MAADYQDPGWRAAIRGVGWFVFPFAHLAVAAADGRRRLVSLRRIYLSLVGSLLLFFVAFAFVAPFGDGWHRVFAWDRREQLPDTAPVTLEEIRAELAARGTPVGYGTVWRFFAAEDISFKKNRARQRARAA